MACLYYLKSGCLTGASPAGRYSTISVPMPSLVKISSRMA